MKIFQVDAFAEHVFEGNPAGVCVMPGPAPDEWMQNMAMEMNLAETAFLYREGAAWMLRWFTPVTEVDLCGHATLASAHILWETGEIEDSEEAVFLTKSGKLTARKADGLLWLNFPAERESKVDAPEALIRALRWQEMVYVGRNRVNYIVELADEAAVRGLRPDFEAMKGLDCWGVMVTSRSTTPGFDFVSRFFAPRAGIPEDPVTGSAHCCLGPYWAERLGKTEFTAWQASPRGGKLQVKTLGDRVLIGGHAVTVFAAELRD